MPVEIERKFMVDLEAAQRLLEGPALIASARRLHQAYLAGGHMAVRVRLDGATARLTLKSSNPGLTRQEFEYDIPYGEGQTLLEGSPHKLSKVRYFVPVGRHTFEVDIFEGKLAGLVLAEIELRREDEVFEKPVWLGREVTHDPKYYNESLAQRGLPEERGDAPRR